MLDDAGVLVARDRVVIIAVRRRRRMRRAHRRARVRRRRARALGSAGPSVVAPAAATAAR